MKREAVIDADGHVFERPIEIREYLEEPWNRRNTPLFGGGYPWDNRLFGTLSYADYPSPLQKLTPIQGLSAEEQVDAWLKLMDRESIETAVLFPTGAAGVAGLREPAWAAAVARAANTHLAKDFGSVSPRVRPVGVLPIREPEVAAKELRRAVTELGLLTFEIPSTGQDIPLGDPFFDPIYAEAERLNVPLCIHGGRGDGVGGEYFKTFSEVHCYVFPASLMLHFTSVMFNAVPLRFPKLRLAFLETGATWLPFYLDRMDEHWELRGEYEMPYLTKKPSDVFRESAIYVTVEPEESLLPQTIDFLGDGHFMYATDFPHWDARFPENLETLEGRKDLSNSVKRKILYENARAFYGV